jgi:hypothetical protein
VAGILAGQANEEAGDLVSAQDGIARCVQ